MDGPPSTLILTRSELAAVVTDATAQSLVMGDLHHAAAAGAMTAEDVRAESAGRALQLAERA
jgi:hypothetical protein